MLSLKAHKRTLLGRKSRQLRRQGLLPGVIFGPELKESIAVQVPQKDFEAVFAKVGESTLVAIELEGKKFSILIHNIALDPLSCQPLHIDFYSPSLTKEVEAAIPLVFEGEAPAVKELGGTLVRNISEVPVRALAQNLPHDIKVDIGALKTFEDYIRIANLPLPPAVKVLRREPDEIVAHVMPPQKVEEELAKPIEEKVEEVEKVVKPEKKEEMVETSEGAEQEIRK